MKYVVIKVLRNTGIYDEAIGVFNSLEQADAYIAANFVDKYTWNVVPWKTVNMNTEQGVQTWRDLS